MDYRRLIMEIIKTKSDTDLLDPIKDYNTLFDMMSNRQYDLKIISDIETKYEKEINMVDSIRVKVFIKKGVSINRPFNVEDKVKTLLNHLIVIMVIRYSKDFVDETIKEKMASEDEKAIYELLCYIRDQRKY